MLHGITYTQERLRMPSQSVVHVPTSPPATTSITIYATGDRFQSASNALDSWRSQPAATPYVMVGRAYALVYGTDAIGRWWAEWLLRGWEQTSPEELEALLATQQE